MSPRMTDTAEEDRAQIENVMAANARIRIELEFSNLRIQQAMQRDPKLRALLTPVVASLITIRKFTQSNQEALGTIWNEQETKRWTSS